MQKVNQRHYRTPLCDKSIPLLFPFEKYNVGITVAAYPILVPSVGAALMECVEERCVEVQTGYSIEITELAAAMWICVQRLPRPPAQPFRNIMGYEVFELVNALSFPQPRSLKHPYCHPDPPSRVAE
jgi:hypothetical protein